MWQHITSEEEEGEEGAGLMSAAGTAAQGSGVGWGLGRQRSGHCPELDEKAFLKVQAAPSVTNFLVSPGPPERGLWTVVQHLPQTAENQDGVPYQGEELLKNGGE